MANWYVDSVAYALVAVWQASHVFVAGSIVRQVSPSIGNERCFRTALGGNSGSSEPTWALTKGSVSPTDGTITDWTEVTGNETYQVSGNWKAPHVRLANAYAWGAHGDIFVCASEHNYSVGASYTLTSPGTAGDWCKVVSVDIAGPVPPTSVTHGAKESTTGANLLALNTGYIESDGVDFISGSGSSSSNLSFATGSGVGIRLKNGTIGLGNTNGSSIIAFGQGNATKPDEVIDLVNMNFKFGAVGQKVQLQSYNLTIRGGAIDGSGSIPTAFFSPNSGNRTQVLGFDFSLMGSSHYLVDAGLNRNGDVILCGCKIDDNVTPMNGTPVGPGGVTLAMYDCAGTGINYKFRYQNYLGVIQNDTGVLLTSGGGASDGTQGNSWKIVTTANANRADPFVAPVPVQIWNDTLSAITVTNELVWDNASPANNDEIHTRIGAFTSAASPLLGYVSNGPTDILATPSAQPTSSGATWSGTSGFGTAQKQHCASSITPALKGPLLVTVVVGRPSATFYVNPLPQVA